ncbi:DUF882 domain-containing protein [Ascidiaceihabitans sp.]|nr:DUF882 domain-containing protein [Ascidiaceihabitans sp.]
MVNKTKISRRLFLSLILSPTLLPAQPLVDFERNLGLFSDPLQPRNKQKLTGTNWFNDPEPEIKFANQLISSETKKIVLAKDFKVDMINSNTKQKISLKFQKEHKLTSNQISELNDLLKDWRTNEIKEIDFIVLRDFLKVCATCSKKNEVLTVNVHSGYRSKKTNESLRRGSYKVAKNSMHILGKAIDFSVDGKSPKQLAKIVRANTLGGVGSYTNFVHLDSGPYRSWT